MNTIDNFNIGIDDISDEGIDFEQFENDIAQEEEIKADAENDAGIEDHVKIYLKKIGKIPLLSREEELEICKKN